jgi:signal transduction histidine kinase
VQEALTNVRRHSAAKKVSITLNREYERLVLTVYDNGKGFKRDAHPDQPGFGLAGMRERARLVNGALDVRSEREQGTRVVLRVPLPVVKGEMTS